MKGKGKYKKSDLSEFLRYSGNKMTNGERNSFERELQKDPFLEEAAEGFEEIPREKVRQDVKILKKRLEARTKQKQRFIYYRIAASVAMLVIITSLFILIERSRSSKQISGNSKNMIALSMPESKPLIEADGERDVKENLPAFAEKKEDKSAPKETARQTEPEDTVKLQTIKTVENTRTLVIKEAEKDVVSDANIISAPVAANLREESVAGRQIRGKVISAEDNHPIPGASVVVKGTNIATITDTGGNFNLVLPDAVSRSLEANYTGMVSKELQVSGDSAVKISLEPSVLALNEAVVVGYGSRKSKVSAAAGAVSRTDTEKKLLSKEYSPPEPLTGRENFDKYIEDNLRRPDILKDGEKAVVVISFIIQSNGILDSIKIIKSPGRQFSEEAVRIIKEGPGWKPAIDKGEAINDEVRIRIVFK